MTRGTDCLVWAISTPNGAELTLLFVPARIRSRARQKGWVLVPNIPDMEKFHTGTGRNDVSPQRVCCTILCPEAWSRWQGARRQHQGPMPCRLARPAPQTLHRRCVSAPRLWCAPPLCRRPPPRVRKSGARCCMTRQTRRASCPRPRSAQLRRSGARPERARTRDRWARASDWVLISRSSATQPSALPSRAR